MSTVAVTAAYVVAAGALSCAGVLAVIGAGAAIGRDRDHAARMRRIDTLSDLDDGTVDPHWPELRQTMPGVRDSTEESEQ